MLAAIGEPLLSDYNVHELPSQEDDWQSCTALAARVEYLKAETKQLRSHMNDYLTMVVCMSIKLYTTSYPSSMVAMVTLLSQPVKIASFNKSPLGCICIILVPSTMVLCPHIQPTTTVSMTTLHVGQMATGNNYTF